MERPGLCALVAQPLQQLASELLRMYPSYFTLTYEGTYTRRDL
jgi:hypothetical protein